LDRAEATQERVMQLMAGCDGTGLQRIKTPESPGPA
jgi:hypothetical protein